MAEKLADLSPEEKEKRIAEMKAKMQAAAAKSKKASSGEAAVKEAAAPAKQARAVPAEASPAVAAAATDKQVSAQPAPAVTTYGAGSNGAAGNGAASNGVASNGVASNGGAAAVSAPLLVAPPPEIAVETPEQRAKKEMNRREFLTYTWGAALGLLALQSGVGIFQFMYPRFKAGEFGGEFLLGPVAALPPTDAAPAPNTSGKFWLVNTVDEGPKALYMVCTHLGCLYKWAQSNNRFECPCHGSKFSREGFYIEGPAPRSLDTFLLTEADGEIAVDTGKKTLGQPSADSPARAVPV